MLLYVAGFYILLPFLTGASLVWGGKPERALAILFVLTTVAQVALRQSWALRYRRVDVGLLMIDLMLVVGLVWIATRFRRWTVTIVAAFQVIVLLGHLAKARDAQFSRAAYSLILSASCYPALIVLALGIWQHARRRKPPVSGTSARS